MILNTGSRTDIPAYFSEWFYQRIKEGFVLVRNPYYPSQVTRFKLDPALIDCLCFCTKNPRPMLERLDEIAAFNQFWFVTMTPYEKDIEPFVPSKDEVRNSFKKLSKKLGPLKVQWRYDPIFISEKYSLDFHLTAFEKFAKDLCGYTDTCVISFIDLFEKTKRNFSLAKEVTVSEQNELAKNFVRMGKEYGIQIKTCLEASELSKWGIDSTGCMTQAVLEKVLGEKLKVPKKKSAREGCDCLLGSDIGAYNTCPHACLYCYANYDQKTVKANLQKHDPLSPFLIGGAQFHDVVREAKQESYLVGQTLLF